MSDYRCDLTRSIIDDRFIITIDREGAEYIRSLTEREWVMKADAGAFAITSAIDDMFDEADS